MPDVRIYDKLRTVSFRKTDQPYGGLSNMAPGYPIIWGIIIVRTSEALYQALKFPHHIDIQRSILLEKSPMVAKWISRKYDNYRRSDWDDIQFKMMKLCLELKLTNNWAKFGDLLLSTSSKDIVEYSPVDKVWSAVDMGAFFTGQNVLGRLLMALRQDYIYERPPQKVYLPPISDVSLLGIDISDVDVNVPYGAKGGDMPSDHDLVACEQDHEMIYILGLYGKSATQVNIQDLRTKCRNFKADINFTPKNRKNFYWYLETRFGWRKV